MTKKNSLLLCNLHSFLLMTQSSDILDKIAANIVMNKKMETPFFF